VATGDTFTPTKIGAEAAATQINAAGRFGGRKVVIDSCNTQNSPTIASTCAHQLIAKKPVAMVGCDLNWPATGFTLYSKAKIPSIQCITTAQDATNPYSVALDPGGLGQYAAISKWLCTKPEVKVVVNQLLDLPQMRKNYPAVTSGILEGCGKKVYYVYPPLTSADYTPYLNEILSHKPDFVMAFALNGPQAVQIFKGFQQNNFPADQMFTVSSAFAIKTGIGLAGDAAEGVYGVLPTASPDDTTNPDVKAYQEAMKDQPDWMRDPTVQTNYMYVQAIYEAAKKTGFDTFDGAALDQYLNTQTGVHLTLSRELTNPGPKTMPQNKQPYGQLVQWKGGKINVVTEGTDDNGWINGAG